ncbi:endosome/lysosome-associated apoptosis and autophagy regulator 1 isoform X2 [Mixophyes fleayi]|uniref:endosome/lysosome-associated apoptosis and autophagy regulator 1 isoform X2 n=1 Tax=Mixophyes fleayi TaxID=3061075 RepID=UPI003F4E40BA
MPEPTFLYRPQHGLFYFLSCVILVLNFSPLQGQLLHACKESEYHYEYTECDSKGTRWRVAVPHTPGLCTGLPDPIKGTECSFSCTAGQYLDMTVQKCTPCGEGTYSLGTGVHFDEWAELPHGFTSISSNQYGADYGATGNCSMSQWGASGEYVASNTDECSATLMYSINLKQEGTINFEYLYPDSNIVFEFFVQNDQCQPREEESRWMKTTENGWSFHQVKLTQGTNVLYWRTAAFYVGRISPKPVLLRNIQITGAAYTSECFPCKPGTFAPNNGTSVCKICPENTFSNRGASTCISCESDKYSVPGSASCFPRPPCTDKDYFYTHTLCDTNGKTQLMYKWIEPKICSNTVEGAKDLPMSGVKIKCPPCNPGFYQTNSSTCETCPHGTFSNGTICRQCPAGTEAVLGFEYKWWNTLPVNMHSTVMSGLNFELKKEAGWEVAGDYIYTSAGSSDNDYMLLTLNIPAFSPPRRVTEDSESNEVSHITFVFDMKCSMNCQFFFMMAVNSEMSSLIESWQGAREKQSYSYRVERNTNTTFTWAFQRTSSETGGRKYTADMVKIYSINVTNTKDGVASWCQPCATGTDFQCISCPPGHYIDKGTSRCISCPMDTYLQSLLPFGVEACTQCGPGTKSNDVHSLCFNDCQLSVSTGGGKLQYDFSLLQNITYTGPPRFTAKGLRYYPQFSISLCGNQGRKLAMCVQNMSDSRGSDTELWQSVVSYVCQSIIMPSDKLVHKTLMSAQPISLGDKLIGVTIDTILDNISSPVDLFPGKNALIKDIIFYYRSKEVTQPCPSGRATTIRLRCNPLKADVGTVSLPSKCPEGTCDGCIFHFLWETEQACPLCTVHDYHIITSVCQHGIQRTTALWHTPRLCFGGVDLPAQTVSICKSADFWLKVGVTIGIISALVLTALTSYFWKKNRNLEYKYSRLMINAPSKDGELPAADSCAIMEGEDAEDELVYSNRRSILRKFMSLSGKRTSDGFDSVPLKSSGGEHMDM